MKTILLFLLLPIAAFAELISGSVVAVSDGDTITLLTSEKVQIKIRLYGIDAPESKQAFGQKSKQALSALIFGKTVSADVKDKDRYGRSIAVIEVGATNVNEEQVKEGMAWWYRTYAKKDARLAQLEGEARAAKLGLWSESDPVPPWEFRRGTGEK